MKASLNNIFLKDTDLSKRIDEVLSLFPFVKGKGTNFELEEIGSVRPRKTEYEGNASQETTTGKNLLPDYFVTETKNGVTLTKNEDGTYKWNCNISNYIYIS